MSVESGGGAIEFRITPKTGPRGSGGCSVENAMSDDKASTLQDFNPSGSDVVSVIKAKTDELMCYIRGAVPENRERSIAITNYEQAAMWAVKANFT